MLAESARGEAVAVAVAGLAGEVEMGAAAAVAAVVAGVGMAGFADARAGVADTGKATVGFPF